MGGSVGASFSELGAMMRELSDARIKVCLDTQHAFAMGYDVASAGGLRRRSLSSTARSAWRSSSPSTPTTRRCRSAAAATVTRT